jgi:3-(3-hydroxy-phenyl)propionate hydroxylase
VARGWAGDALLDGYAREQRPVAAEGSGEMAQAAHRYMAGQAAAVKAMSGTAWANALTRTMLGVRLGVDEAGDWSMVRTDRGPFRIGDRIPDAVLHGPNGRPIHLHDLIDDSFVALYFTDVRRRPHVPSTGTPGLKHFVVSHRDAPLDSGLRDRSLFDVGDRFRQLMGCPTDTLVLVRPDDHISAITTMGNGRAEELYRAVVGRGCVQEFRGDR